MPAANDGVRLTAIDTALGDLERALVRDRCHVVVSVPAGPARMLLQGALAGRLAGALRVVLLPELADGADGELCAAILRELGEPPGDDPEATLVGVARRLAGQRSALALVAGDARSLSLPTLRLLGRLVARAKPGLRLVLLSVAGTGSGDALGEIMTPLGIGAVKVVLEAPRERGAATATPAPPRSPLPVAPMRARSAARAPIRVAGAEPARRVPPAPWRASLGLAIAALGLVAIQQLGLPSLPEAAAPPARRVAVPEQRTAPAERSEPAPALPEAPPQPVASTPPSAPEVAPPEPPAPPAEPEVAEATPVTDVPALPELPALQPAAPEVVVAGMLSAEIAADAGATPAPGPPEVAAPAAPAPELPTPEPVAAAEPEAPAPPNLILVSLNADPWAHIQVDGRDVGVTPMSDLALTPGPHRFRVRFPDGRVIERTVRVDALRDHIRFP